MGDERHRQKRREALVTCDARWDQESGVAVIAITGALGTHAVKIPARSSMIAEGKAVLFAMDMALATGGRAPTLVFRTDCKGLVEARRLKGEQGQVVGQIRRRLARFRQWELEYAHRKHTSPAHQAAKREWRR